MKRAKKASRKRTAKATTRERREGYKHDANLRLECLQNIADELPRAAFAFVRLTKHITAQDTLDVTAIAKFLDLIDAETERGGVQEGPSDG